ncbi:hypothetical protein K0M31_003678 [Melipona bicolor]|uniref:Uncharacterized protein n=1 Tax=Melipona bicolor TaxID=60889 RepID=A0AA40FY22_9HYME|nr:hypothetical protein K0M31_003678 [Melipona bicolor]
MIQGTEGNGALYTVETGARVVFRGKQRLGATCQCGYSVGGQLTVAHLLYFRPVWPGGRTAVDSASTARTYLNDDDHDDDHDDDDHDDDDDNDDDKARRRPRRSNEIPGKPRFRGKK